MRSRHLVALVVLVLAATSGVAVSSPASTSLTSTGGGRAAFGPAVLAPVASSTLHGVEPSNRTSRSSLELAAVYPNPATEGDAGEFVTLAATRPTNLSGWALSDGEDVVALPPVTVSGCVAVSPDPALARNRTDCRVLRIRTLSLSNEGERIVLRHDGRSVDVVRYENAPEAETYADGTWTPLGASDFPVFESGPANATAFVLPDAPAVPIDALDSARRRILLAGYTLTSERVARALHRAAARGVTVRVFVEGGPVGGLSQREARLLDSLSAAGVSVRVEGGPRARYDFHHAKYAVVDDRALVLTENWKPAGTGGRSSRGWGVLVDGETAAQLAHVFDGDFGAVDAVPWRRYRRGRSFVVTNASTGSYPAHFDPHRVHLDRVDVLVAPDNAAGRVTSLLRRANDSIMIEQMNGGSPDSPFVRAAIAAARRGVSVQVLLSNAWYVRDDNAALVRRLNAIASRENVPLEARLVAPHGRFEKVHAKGVIVDRDTVVLGSMNWNVHSARKNREVDLALYGSDAGEYYAGVFAADWRASGGANGDGNVPLGLLAAVAAAALAVGWLASRFEFDDGADEFDG